MLSHHYVQQTVVLGTLSVSAPVSAHLPKKRSFAVTESWSQLETMTWLAQEGMASKPASLLTKHGLVSRCKNPRIAVMSGVQSFLLRRPEFVQSCWHCNGFPPDSNRQSASSISIRFPIEFVRSSVSLTVEKWIELFHAAYGH